MQVAGSGRRYLTIPDDLRRGRRTTIGLGRAVGWFSGGVGGTAAPRWKRASAVREGMIGLGDQAVNQCPQPWGRCRNERDQLLGVGTSDLLPYFPVASKSR